MVCLCMMPLQKLGLARDNNTFVLLLNGGLLQPFPRKVTDRHLIRVDSSRSSKEKITELHSLIFPPPFNLILFMLGNTKKTMWPHPGVAHHLCFLLWVLMNSFESRESLSQTC